MQFLKGKPEHLSGRAVIFLDLTESADLSEDQEATGLLAVFCAASEMDLLELIIQVMHLPREHSRLISRFYKRYFQEIETIKRTFPARISKIIDEVIRTEQQEVSGPVLESFREMFRRNAETEQEAHHQGKSANQLPQPEFYSTMVPLPGRDFISPYIQSDAALEFDILDLERTEHLEVGHLVLDAEARLYLADYLKQNELRIHLPDQKKYRSPYKNYKQLSKSEFKKILSEISSELMYLIETGSDTNRAFADLKQLTSGSHFLREVVSLYNISTTQDPNKIRLMDLYFRKILSLVDEDYLLTKKIEEEIQTYRV